MELLSSLQHCEHSFLFLSFESLDLLKDFPDLLWETELSFRFCGREQNRVEPLFVVNAGRNAWRVKTQHSKFEHFTRLFLLNL